MCWLFLAALLVSQVMICMTATLEESTALKVEKEAEQVSNKPIIIGVITQVLRDYKRFVLTRHLHLPSSYVKWIESAGAQVLPILLNQDDAYYERVFKLTNGLVFPGGDNLLDPSKRTPMMVAAQKLYKLAIEANNRGEHYPIWGTCLGFELLSVLSANKNVLADCSTNDLALNVTFEPKAGRGRLFSKAVNDDKLISNGILPIKNLDYSQAVMQALQEGNLTYNFHHKCLTRAGLREAGLEGFYRVLAYSYDKNGLEFITIMEAYSYPFYGVQFHPEKPAFEFVVKKSQQNIPHSRDALAASRYFADFFVSEARFNQAKRKSTTLRLMEPRESLEEMLIYAQNAMYTGLKRDMYEQRYLFPFSASNSTTTEEFLDYIPGEDEEPGEDVADFKRRTSEQQAAREKQQQAALQAHLILAESVRQKVGGAK